MKYRESALDIKLRNRFKNDNAHSHLRRIRLTKGAIRGLTSFDIALEYPITAIAGANGCGKSTILALACCAFHNAKGGYRPPKRRVPYYTFKDFFVQHVEEVSPQGISISYAIAHDNWSDGEPRVAQQIRTKPKGGKWNDYSKRVRRDVIFVGIDRIVPHSERSQSRSYSRAFKDAKLKGWEEKVRKAVGFVLNRSYDEFRFLEHSKYNLPLVKVGTNVYSGFNMGAGENALFEIFSLIYSCGPGALFVIDEIELGLHVEAQKKFVHRLKSACWDTHSQVICTTHAREIFDCLPYDARYLVEQSDGKARITNAISSDFAFSKLAAVGGMELDILVEDEVAKVIVQSCLAAATRSRVKVHVIGSSSAVARQLAAAYLKKDSKDVLAIFDGDQRANEADLRLHAQKMTEKNGEEFGEWYNTKIGYLPGATWPEDWIVRKAQAHLAEASPALCCEIDEFADLLDHGLQAGKHSEFHEIATRAGMEKGACLQLLVSAICQACPQEFDELRAKVTEALVAAG